MQLRTTGTTTGYNNAGLFDFQWGFDSEDAASYAVESPNKIPCGSTKQVRTIAWGCWIQTTTTYRK